jgi:hypothetical protein
MKIIAQMGFITRSIARVTPPLIQVAQATKGDLE